MEEYYNNHFYDHGMNDSFGYDNDYENLEWPADYDSVSGNDGDEMDYDSVSENDGDEVIGDRIIFIKDESDQAVIFVSGNDDPEVIIIADQGDPAVIFVSCNYDPEVIIIEV